MAVALWVAAMLLPTSSAGIEIGPEADLCAAIDALNPGEELLLSPGEHRAGCAIRRGGLPGAPIVIGAADPDRRPRLIEPGRPVNLLEVRANDVIIRNLDFGPGGESDGVRIIHGNRIAVEGCRFIQLGGIAVVANHTSVRGLTVRGNVIADAQATGMYFGCHDASCTVSDLVVEGNYIRGVSAPDPEIGYGLEVKLNSSGVIRDNVIVDTKGPGIMVYGARDLMTVSVVERNFTSASRRSSGIVIGGGPAVVRNNISTRNLDSGIGLENYGRRGLLRGILVSHNSIHGNRHAGISVPDQGPIEARIVNNAVHARAGTLALPTMRPSLRLLGNADCARASCFTNPGELDFSPFPGSLLFGAGILVAGDAAATDDYFGSPRRIPPTVGAVDGMSGPVRLGLPQR
ncbi:MAG: right-handed parallel beta-helix repeat-containing protein [Candidatus Rokuibacteriota bacterium]